MSFISDIYSNVVPFTILLGILVFVHELGHFLVARACGVRVEVFSLGFGKKILSYKNGDTTYCISIVPLGGYVKMFGEQSTDPNSISPEERKVSYSHKTVWQRIAIVLAGPLMNFFFAVLVFGFVAYRGEDTRAARLADVTENSVAATAGIQSHDLVLSVNGEKVRSYEEFQAQLNQNKEKEVTLEVQQLNSDPRSVKVLVTSVANPNIFSSESKIGSIEGLQPYAKGSTIAVLPDTPAYKSGLRTGDEITAINTQKINSWGDLAKLNPAAEHEVKLVRPTSDSKTEEIILKIDNTKNLYSDLKTLGLENPELYLEQIVPDSPAAKADLHKYDKIISINGTPVTQWETVLNMIKNYNGSDAFDIVILREGTEILKKITPQMTSQMTMQGKEDKRYTIGIMPLINVAAPEMTKVTEDSIFAATGKGFKRAWDISVITVMSFVRLLQGEVSHKNIGGMISIGKVAKDSYAMGLQPFLMTMGILSISLFILNLLPIPVLDGGHLVFYAIEAIKGSPLSGKKLEIAHQIGFALLMGLMILALFNDFTKFLFKT